MTKHVRERRWERRPDGLDAFFGLQRGRESGDAHPAERAGTGW